MKKINIITGHYGSGKTTIALNTALRLAQNNKKVSIVDLDIVNPYFRTSDFPELLKKNSIEMIAPMYAGSNLDIPAVNFDMERIISESSHVVIDVGGDDAGAYALGICSLDRFNERADGHAVCHKLLSVSYQNSGRGSSAYV